MTNGEESDIDCGGDQCVLRCAGGHVCIRNSDCASSRCLLAASGGLCTDDTEYPTASPTVNMSHHAPRTAPACVWWDAAAMRFRNQGCKAARVGPEGFECECNHLTDFAVVRDFRTRDSEGWLPYVAPVVPPPRPLPPVAPEGLGTIADVLGSTTFFLTASALAAYTVALYLTLLAGAQHVETECERHMRLNREEEERLAKEEKKRLKGGGAAVVPGVDDLDIDPLTGLAKERGRTKVLTEFSTGRTLNRGPVPPPRADPRRPRGEPQYWEDYLKKFYYEFVIRRERVADDRTVQAMLCPPPPPLAVWAFRRRVDIVKAKRKREEEARVAKALADRLRREREEAQRIADEKRRRAELLARKKKRAASWKSEISLEAGDRARPQVHPAVGKAIVLNVEVIPGKRLRCMLCDHEGKDVREMYGHMIEDHEDEVFEIDEAMQKEKEAETGVIDLMEGIRANEDIGAAETVDVPESVAAQQAKLLAEEKASRVLVGGVDLSLIPDSFDADGRRIRTDLASDLDASSVGVNLKKGGGT